MSVAFINTQTVEMMVAASSGCKPPGQSAIGKIIILARAAGNVAMLTINPQSAKLRPH